MEEQVRGLLDAAIERWPQQIPPDQVGPARRQLERVIVQNLVEARDTGGIDYYLPTDVMHGQRIAASFVVAAVIPDAAAPDAVTGQVLAELLRTTEGSRPVTVDGTVWVRSEKVIVRAPDESSAQELVARRVEYLTAIPSEQRRWIIATFTTYGDGDPDGEVAHLLVQLFDAIMSTWRWLDE
jgi:hypothetical protein